MTDNESIFERLLNEEQALNLRDDLNCLDCNRDCEATPGESDPGWELTFTFTKEDIPHILREIDEMIDDGD